MTFLFIYPDQQSILPLFYRGFDKRIDLFQNKETVIKEIVLCDSSETAVKKFTEALGKLKSSNWVFFEHGKPLQVNDFLTSCKLVFYIA
jgi:hypothetical protein